MLVGDDPGRWRVGRLLGHPWIAGLGNASYALYLVHWPILIAYVVAIDRDEPNLVEGAAIIGASLVLAWLLHRFVEVPLRRRTAGWRPWRDAVLVAVGIAMVLGSVAGWRQFVRTQPDPARVAVQQPQHPGARVLDPAYRAQGVPTEPSTPTLAELPHQWAIAGSPCPKDWQLPTRAQQQCQVLTDPNQDAASPGTDPLGDLPLAVDEGVTRVLLVGNSHVQHWASAVRQIGVERGWQVVLIYEQNCSLAPAGDPINTLEKCVDFWPDALNAIEPLDPDVLLTVGTRSEYDGETVLRAGLELLAEHAKPGRTIVAMRDTPRFEVGLVQCDAERRPDDPPCAAGHPILETPNPLTRLVAPIAGMATLDLAPLVCPERRCVAEVGNVKVWMDQHHLTRAYIETTTELVAARLMRAIEGA